MRTRDTFDYDRYAVEIVGANQEKIDEFGIGDELKVNLYDDAIKRTFQESLNQNKGRGKQKTQESLRQTIDLFDESRKVLGVPEEITDTEEPFSAQSFSNFLDTVEDSASDLSVDDVLGNYASSVLKDQFVDFERPFLKDFTTTSFKKRVKSRLKNKINFEGTVSKALTELNKPIEQTELNEINLEDVSNDRDFIDSSVSFGKNLGIGLWNSFVSTVSGGSRLIDAGIDSVVGPDIAWNPKTSLYEDITDDADSSLKSFADSVDDIFQIESEALTTSDKIAQGLGQVGGIIATAGVGSFVGGAKLATAIAGVTGVSQGASQANSDYLQAVQENKTKFHKGTSQSAILLGGLIGGSEALVPLGALKKLTKGTNIPLPAFFSKVDKVTGTAFKQTLQKGLDNKLANAVIQGVPGALAEGSQELLAGIATNLVASDILKYDTERGFWTDETSEDAEIGAYVGGILNGVIGVFVPKQRSKFNKTLTDNGVTEPPNETSRIAPSLDLKAQDVKSTNNFNELKLENISEQHQISLNSIPNITGIGQTTALAKQDLLNKILDQTDGDTSIIDIDSLESALKLGSKSDSVEPGVIASAQVSGETVQSAGQTESIAKLNLHRKISSSEPTNYNKNEGGLEIFESQDGTFKIISQQGFTVASGINAADAQLNYEQTLVQSGQIDHSDLSIQGVERVVVNEDNVHGIGDNLQLANLDRINNLEKLQFDDLENATISIDKNEDTVTGVLKVGDTNVQYIDEGTNDSGQLSQNHVEQSLTGVLDSAKQGTIKLTDGLKINRTNNGENNVEQFSASVNDGELFTDSSIEGAVKLALNSPSNTQQTTNISIVSNEITKPVDINLTSKNTFNQNNTNTSLSQKGFNTLSLTPNKLIAHKDGLIYEINLNKTQSKLKVMNLDGVEVSNTQLQVDSNTLSLVPINNGVTINPDLSINTESLSHVAESINGQIIETNDPRLAIIKKGNLSTVFSVSDNGNIRVTADNKTININSGVQLIDQTDSIALTNANVSRQLELRGYSIDSVKGNDNSTSVVVLLSKDDDQIKLTKSSDNMRISRKLNGRFVDQKIKTLPELRSKLKLSELEQGGDVLFQLDESINQTSIFGTSNRISDDIQKGMVESLKNVKKTANRLEIINDKPTLKNETGPDVILDLPNEHDPETFLHQIKAETTYDGNSDSNLDSDGWTIQDINSFKDLLPDHIQAIVNIHSEGGNLAQLHNANGVFIANGDNGPQIHIDASDRRRNFNEIVGTLSHELSHFSFDMWGNKQLTELYDRAFEILRVNINDNLRSYIKMYNVDMDNPTNFGKWVLINEYFATQNTTFLDFQPSSLTTLPPGVTQERMEQLKQDVKNTIPKVVIDLTKGSTKDSDVQFIENILRLQSGSVLGRGIHVTFTRDEIDGTTSDMVIRSTPHGTETIISSNTQRARDLQKITEKTRGTSGFDRKAKLLWLKFGPGSIYQTPAGRDISILVNGKYTNASSKYAQDLEDFNVKAKQVRSILDDAGFTDVQVAGSYYQTFKKLGIGTDNQGNSKRIGLLGKVNPFNKTKALRLAKEMDDFLNASKTRNHSNVAIIHGHFKNTLNIIQGLSEKHPNIKTKLPEIRKQIQQQLDKFSTDWTHRMYDSHTPSGLKKLRKIAKDLKVITKVKEFTLLEEFNKAKLDIGKIESKVKNGKLTHTKGKVQINKLNAIVKLNDRIESLKLWSRATIKINDITALKDSKRITFVEARERIQLVKNDIVENKSVSLNNNQDSQVLGVMRSEVDRQLNREESLNLTDNLKTLEGISASRNRKLDENDARDVLMMQFLDPITDPLQIAIHSLGQQNKIIGKLDFDIRLGKSLLESDVARPIGSKFNPDKYGVKGDTEQAKGNEGSLMSFLEIDPEYAQHLNADITLQDSINSNLLGRNIGLIKSMKTVFNIDLGVQNYTGNLQIALSAGHLRYLAQFKNELSDIKSEFLAQTFKDNATFNLGKSDTLTKSLLQEMRDSNVFSTGENDLEVTLANHNMVNQALELATGIIKDSGAIKEGQKIKIDSMVSNVLRKFKKFYARGDDYVKILPYLINREIGVAKAHTIISVIDYTNSNFPDGQLNPEYQRAILDIAIPFAKDRTLRETTAWTVAHGFFRALAANKTANIFTPDFVQHQGQMLKVTVENARIVAEDTREIKRVKEQIQVTNDEVKLNRLNEYLKTVTKSRNTRALFNISQVGSSIAVANFRLSLLGLSIYGLAGIFATEEDELPGNLSNLDAIEGRQRMLAVTQFSDYKSPIPYSGEGNIFWTVNANRSGALNAIIPIAPATTDPDARGYIGKFFSTYLNAERPSIAVNLWRSAIRGVGFFDEKLTDSERVKNTLNNWLPGSIKRISEISELDNESTGSDVIEAVLPITAGLKPKRIDVRDIISTFGFKLRNTKKWNSNATRRSMHIQLSTGESLDAENFIDNIRSDIKYNEDRMQEVNFFFEAARMGGKQRVPENTLRQSLFKRSDGVTNTGVTRGEINKLLLGVNIFHQSSLKSLNTQHLKFKNSQPNLKFSRDELDNIIKAYDKAIKLYEVTF